ncbi:MAG TPA: response regulator [Candidatus Sulfotelmatobacter sp.]|jgi:CheY-like chemotaxis protein|nr:response regulator [Candidatus Acidoferrales bacterium]HUD63822.1 response regulator [Candidatus Sulfotelmatobacter sp.]
MTRILVADDDRTTRLLLSETLRAQKYTVVAVEDGATTLKKLKENKFDLALLDVWMPKMNGLEVLAKLRNAKTRPKVIVMTSDDTPQTLLSAIREEAYTYVAKPIDPQALVILVKETLAKKSGQGSIEVVSASPTWVELVVPCSLEEAERIEAFMAHLKTGLSEDVRRSVGQAFHELLLNAVEWGGKLDPNRKVRISYLRARRMLMYRIADPGPGFKFADLDHAAISHEADEPTKHDKIREDKGLRPGGFGLLLTQANVDELLYNEKQNEVVFVKYLEE